MTYDLFNNSVEIDEGISGAYEFFKGVGGHTGSFDLRGAGFASYLNTEGIGVNGSLNVTGSQQIEGNLTGYNFNHLANLSVTGLSSLSHVTGTSLFANVDITGEADVNQFINGIDVSGDSQFYNNVSIDGEFRSTGDTLLEGNLYVNGNTRVTGELNIDGSFLINGSGISDFFDPGSSTITGDPFSFFAEKLGQLIVGTGAGTGAILDTDSASSGWALVVNPNNSFGIEWQDLNLVDSETITGFYSNKVDTQIDVDGRRRLVSLYPDFGGTVRTDVNINTIGSGAFFLGPTGEAVDPGARKLHGAYSIDLQLGDPSTATGVDSGAALGHRSTILGGMDNTAAANYSIIAGGSGNSIENSYLDRDSSNFSQILGGRGNFIEDAANCGIIGGQSNSINGTAIDNSFIIGAVSDITASHAVAMGYSNTVSNIGGFAIGYSNTVSADYSIALGRGCTSTRYGEIAHASGNSTTGKTSIFTSQRSTTDATQTELLAGGERITIATDTTCTFTIQISAQQDSTSGGNAAAYKIEGCIKNISGTTSLVGSITKTVIAEDDAAWDVTAEADDTNDALAIKVTGKAATNIRWAATSILTEVTYA